MNTRVLIGELLRVVKPHLRTIDLRALLFHDQKGLWNSIAVLRFRIDLPNRIQKEQKQATAVLGTDFKSAVFEVLAENWEMSHLNEILSVFAEGKIPGHASALLGYKLDIGAQRATVSRTHGFLDCSDQWPAGECSVLWDNQIKEPGLVQDPQYRLQTDEVVVHELSIRGLTQTTATFQRILGISPRQSGPWVANVYIAVEVPARIQEMTLSGRCLSVLTEGDLKDFVVRLSAANYGEHGYDCERIQSQERNGTSFQVNDQSLSVILEATMAHPSVGVIDLHRKTLREILPVAVANPLLWALNQFCSLDEFGNSLLMPHEVSEKKKPQHRYEQHVSWFLSCIGLSNIVLGRFELLKARKTGVEMGSVDIIAVSPDRKRLLLVDCTLNVPKPEEIAKLTDVCLRLAAQLEDKNSVEIRMAIFTGAHAFSGYANEAPHFSLEQPLQPIIIDRTRMKEALDILQDKDYERLCEWFFPPKHY